MKLWTVALLACLFTLPGCSSIPFDKIVSTVERFPIGTVLDAAKQVSEALTTKPVPAPDVTK